MTSKLDEILDMTREIFPGPVSAELTSLYHADDCWRIRALASAPPGKRIAEVWQWRKRISEINDSPADKRAVLELKEAVLELNESDHE